MLLSVGDFDYTQLAGLRGKIVILSDVILHRCAGCGPAASHVQIRRMADLHRELDAAKALHVKRLWCQFADNEWAIVVDSTVTSPKPK